MPTGRPGPPSHRAGPRVRGGPFLAEITSWLAGDAPVLFSEFGQSTAPLGQPPTTLQVGEADAASYTGATLDALRDSGSIGALIWCYADYAAHLHNQPPLDLALHERTFGLWRADSSPKPAVAEISARRGRPRRTDTRPRPWLDIAVDEFASDRRHHLTRLYTRYRQSAGAL